MTWLCKKHSVYVWMFQVVSTNIEVNSQYSGKDAILAYQMVEASQLMIVRVLTSQLALIL